jgi:hypothetical protein
MNKFIIFDVDDNLQKLLIGLTILIGIVVMPILISLIFPTFNIGGSNYGCILAYLYNNFYLSEIGWISYFLFFTIIGYLSVTQIQDSYKKTASIILCIFLIYMAVYPILTIINVILRMKLNNPPFIKNISEEFLDNHKFEESYQYIQNEYNSYNKLYKIDCLRENNPGLSTLEKSNTSNNCWRSLYLKKLGKVIPEMAQFFPKTIDLIQNDQIHTAFFSILDPNVEITPHTGYFKGYLRYHLGVIIPSKLDQNNNKLSPYIICGGEKYHWEEGKGVLFDDMYLHYVKNPTNETRVVLYLDVKRNNLNKVYQSLIDFGGYYVENSYILQKFLKNQHMQTKNEE